MSESLHKESVDGVHDTSASEIETEKSTPQSPEPTIQSEKIDSAHAELDNLRNQRSELLSQRTRAVLARIDSPRGTLERHAAEAKISTIDNEIETVNATIQETAMRESGLRNEAQIIKVDRAVGDVLYAKMVEIHAYLKENPTIKPQDLTSMNYLYAMLKRINRAGEVNISELRDSVAKHGLEEQDLDKAVVNLEQLIVDAQTEKIVPVINSLEKESVPVAEILKDTTPENNSKTIEPIQQVSFLQKSKYIFNTAKSWASTLFSGTPRVVRKAKEAVVSALTLSKDVVEQTEEPRAKISEIVEQVIPKELSPEQLSEAMTAENKYYAWQSMGSPDGKIVSDEEAVEHYKLYSPAYKTHSEQEPVRSEVVPDFDDTNNIVMSSDVEDILYEAPSVQNEVIPEIKKTPKRSRKPVINELLKEPLDTIRDIINETHPKLQHRYRAQIVLKRTSSKQQRESEKAYLTEVIAKNLEGKESNMVKHRTVVKRTSSKRDPEFVETK